MVSQHPAISDHALHTHVVQFYEADQPQLIANVSRYLLGGLERGEGLLVIATELHSEQFRRELARLGQDVDHAILEHQVLFLDAHGTLMQFLVNGEPDAARFESVIRSAIQDIRPCSGGSLRAYGEMVGLLWSAGRFSAAIRLEELWNALLTTVGFKLF